MKVFWFFFTKKNRKRFFLRKEAKTFDQWMGRRCVPKRRPIVFFSEGLPHHRKRPGSQGAGCCRQSNTVQTLTNGDRTA
jgi:hypothetical protein